jgi:molecular chaperone DnaK
VPQIEVKFDIDVNGIVHVSAKDLGTGREQSITITGSTRLKEEEIQRMVKEAERYAEEDRKRKEEAEVRNQADSMLYQAERTLKEFRDRADRATVERLEKAMADLREALDGKDIERIRQRMEDLTKPLYELTTAMYQQRAQAGSGGGPGQNGKTVDADFDVKDK